MNHHNDTFNHAYQHRGLLGSGWRPLNRQVEWGYLLHLLLNDTEELVQQTLDITSDIADALGRKDYPWWANLFNVFSENTRYELDEFWEYITPNLPEPNRRDKETLKIETPLSQQVSRDNIPIDFVLKQLQEIAVLKILDVLGRPDLITQEYQERNFYYPLDRFTRWDRLEVLGTVYAHWNQPQIWLELSSSERGKRTYTLIANDLGSWANKATYNLAIMLSGYQSRVGQVQSQFAIRQFPPEIQSFTDTVQEAIFNQQRLAVLVCGAPGTGKTAWTQAVAKEILVQLGYVIFILDRDGVENFVPPSYLERVAIILNEADNLAQNRASEVAQRSGTTEHILSLLDGTLYQSVVDESGRRSQQRLVVLMTCNTTERLDPALLRKGRVDLTCEFTHQFV